MQRAIDKIIYHSVYTLLNQVQYFIDPSTASLETRKKACHNTIQALRFQFIKNKSFDLTHKWISTIADTLNSNLDIRNEVLNALAWKKKLLPKSKVGSWGGKYPNFHCGIFKLNVDLASTLEYRFDKDVEGHIKKILPDIFGNTPKDFFVITHGYRVRGQDMTIETKQTGQNEHLDLIFLKWHDSKSYRWVTSGDSSIDDAVKVTYWLEENSTKYRELLTLNNGEVVDMQLLNKLNKETYSDVTVNTELKIDLTQNSHGLALLAWFQPISTIAAFRSSRAPYALDRIVFTALNISFNIQEIEGKKRAVSLDYAPTFYIAEEQRPANKIPALNNLTSYLLLENAQQQNRIILTKSILLTATASWLMKSGTGLTTSHLMDSSLNKMMINSIASIEKLINVKSSSHYVYSLDDHGRLISDEPTALLHLLLYLIAKGQWSDIAHYLTLFEGSGKRKRFPPEVFSLIQYIETAAMVIDNPTVLRIALRLTAIKEENVLIQLESKKAEPESPSATFLAWFTMQVNIYKNFKNPTSLPHLPLDEYQELFILHAIAENGKKLILNNEKLEAISNPNFKKILDIIGLEQLSETLLMPHEISQRYAFLKHKYASKDEFKTKFSSFTQEILQESFLNTSGLNANKTTVSYSSENLASNAMPGMQESAVKQLLALLSNNSQLSELVSEDQHWNRLVFDDDDNPDSEIMHAYNKSLAIRISSEWERVPLKFEELSSNILSSHFLSYYQLALEKPPKAIYNDQKNCNTFLTRAKAFKKSLLLAQGKDPREKKLLDILRCAAEASNLAPFPNPQNYEIVLSSYNQLAEEIIAKRLELKNNISENEVSLVSEKRSSTAILNLELNSLSKKYICLDLKEIETFHSKIERAYSIASALPTIKDAVLSFAQNQASSVLFMGAMSYLPAYWGVSIPNSIKIAGNLGVAAYKGYQTYDALSRRYEQIETKKIQAKADKLAFDEKNQKVELPLPNEWLAHLDADDTLLAKPFQLLIKTLFKTPKTNRDEIDKIPPFACPSDNPIVKKAFAELNQSMDDFYARPLPEIISEELNDLESFYQLKFELEKSKKQLQKNLNTLREKLLQPTQSAIRATLSDENAIARCIKERSFKVASDNYLTTESKFNALIMAFVKNDDSEIMRCGSCEESQLPAVKLQLYRYLIQATRLQQVNRALEIQLKINPIHLCDSEKVLSPETTLDLKIRLKQLSFELSRKRAYSFSNAIPTRLLRGYLAFEYGTGMMLWDKQVKQLQQMLLGNDPRSILELIMGSGKTAFGNPMISFFGSNGSQVIANFFPDALATENIKDLSSRSIKVVGQLANGLKFSRETPLNEGQLWGLQRLLMRSLDFKESLNACKKDFQALQLLFIEEAHKATNDINPINENILWAYMQVLGFIRKKVRANIDEAHRLLRYNDELNHPLGEKKSVKKSYVNVISECMRLLVAIPEVKKSIELENNDQTLCSSEKYHEILKPLIAKKLFHYRPFGILPEQQQVFVDYLCGKLTAIPQFVLEHPHYSEIGLAVGVLNKFLPDALQKKINVHFGIKGNESGYAQPYSSKDTPIENSTFKNPYEAILKTFMAHLHKPLYFSEAEKLALHMHQRAKDKSKKDGKPFDETPTARLFENWTEGKIKLNEVLHDNFSWSNLAKILNTGYAPRMSYARVFSIPKVEYFTENMSCNSQNFASLFSSFYAATATPNAEEICPTGTKIFWDPGTAGEFVDHICRTCSRDKIKELENRSPQEVLLEILRSQFNANSTKKALIDSGSLLYGMSNEFVASMILQHIAKSRPDIQAVVFFNFDNELMLKEYGKSAVSLASSSIPPEKRITYFDQSHTFGADIPQAIGAGGEVTLNEKIDLKDFAQGSWRMRGIKTAQQDISLLVGKAAKEVIKSNGKLTIRDVVSFTTKNKALNEEEGIFPSAVQQVEDVIRTAVYDLMLNAKDAFVMLGYFREFSSLFVTSSDEDPCYYGDPEVETDSMVALQEIRRQKFKIVITSFAFNQVEKETIWNELMKIGKGSTFPEKIKLYKKNGKLISRTNDLGMSQHVSLQVSQHQSQNKEVSSNQNVERNQNQEKEQNQDLQIDICSQEGSSSDTKLRKDSTIWDKEIDYFGSLDWWEALKENNSNNQQIEIYAVEAALAKAKSKSVSCIANAFGDAFGGAMHWSNNLQGILADGFLAEPCSKKQMLELLVIQGPAGSNEEESPLITCAIDQSEARFWQGKRIIKNFSKYFPDTVMI